MTPIPPSGSYKIFGASRSPLASPAHDRASCHRHECSYRQSIRPSANVACNNQITLWSINTLTGTHRVSIKRVFVTGVVFALEPAVRELDAALFPFLPQIGKLPFFFNSACCASAAALTPITSQTGYRNRLMHADQLTGLPSAIDVEQWVAF